MFEAQVLYLVRRLLGQYVVGLSPEALQISVWKGDVVLKDLQLKAEAFNALRIPVTVKAGFLGSVTLKVPWNKLGKEPVIVLLDRVFVLAEPLQDDQLFTKENKELWLEAKRSRIEVRDLAMQEKSLSSADSAAAAESKSWLESLCTTILGNLKISVTNLHIRYEDTLSNPSHPYCFGVTLAKLAAVTVDENGVETFVTSGALDRLNKSLHLEQLSVYHDADTQPWVLRKRWDQLVAKEWSELFEPSINGKNNHQYLLHPVKGVMRYSQLGKRDKRESETPLQRVLLQLGKVQVSMTESQYRDGMKLLEGVSRYRRRMEFSHFRPLGSVKEDPKGWWKYACRAVLQQQKASRCKFHWEDLSRLCVWRKKYVQLYASTLPQGKLDDPELRDIERELDVEVILLWRLLARAKAESARLEEAAIAREKARRSSWFSFGWGTYGSSAAANSSSFALDTESGPGNFTKEEWNKINELLNYQTGQESASGQEEANMLQILFEVILEESDASIKDGTDLEISRGTFSNLHFVMKMYPRTVCCDTKLTSYGLHAPEGPLIESVIREGRSNALELKFIYGPLEDQLDWKLSVALSPCHVTIWRSSFDRVIHFLQSGHTLSPAVALETAAALQTKFEEVTRKAQEQLQLQLQEQRRFSIDLDIDAPKVRIPISKSEYTATESQLLIDLGHFNLRTVEENDIKEAVKPNRYSKFFVVGRDMSALFVDGGFSWSDLPALTTSAENSRSASPSSDVLPYKMLPVLDRCGMTVMLHQARWESPNSPSTCVAIEVPRLGLHFSPARYARVLHLLHALEDGHQPAGRSDLRQKILSWKPEDFAGDARVLLWSGIGNTRAQWDPCWLALAGSYLYLLDNEDSVTYRRCLSMHGKHVCDVPPEIISGSENVIAVCSRGLDVHKVVESSNGVLLQLKNSDVRENWMKFLTHASYRSSTPIGFFSEVEETIGKTFPATNPGKQVDLFVSGVLKELHLSVSGKTGSNALLDEVVIAELQALGGEVNLLQRPFDMKIAVKLHSLRIEDKLQGYISPSCKYVARSVLSSSLQEDEYRDAVSDFGSDRFVSSWEADQVEFGAMWDNIEEVFDKVESDEAADFVRVMLILRQTQSPEYSGTDTEMTMRMATLDFFCNRPTLVAFIDFGTQLAEIADAEQGSSPSLEWSEAEDNNFVKGLFGRGKSRVFFRLNMAMESARIFLNLEDGSQLAMLAQEKFLMDLKVFPGSFTVLGNLGNLRVCDMKLGPQHQWGWLCDIRDSNSGSLVELEFKSYSRDDDDYQGFDYSLAGKMSAVRIVFLYRFIQEVTSYFTALAPPQAQQIFAVVDVAEGGGGRLIQKFDLDGYSALKMDLSLDTPIIIMPRSSQSKEFMELDLGHLKLSNAFEWHGGTRDVPSSVFLDVLNVDIGGINLVVGIDGKAGKPMIQHTQGLQVIIKRPLRDLFHKVPEAQVDVQVQTLCGRMSDREYLVIVECAATNVSEPVNLPPNFRESLSSESDEQEASPFKSVQLEDYRETHYFTKIWVSIDVQYAELELFKGIEREAPLARVEIHGFWLGYRFSSTLETDIYVTLPKLSIVDLRPGTKPEMRMMFGSMADVETTEHDAKSEEWTQTARLTMLVMDVRMKSVEQRLVLRMQRPRLLVVVDFLLEMTQFFMPSLVAFTSENADASQDPATSGPHLRLTSSVYQQQAQIVSFSPQQQLIADAYDVDTFVYDGCGKAISIDVGDDYTSSAVEPVIIIGYGKTLQFKNVHIKNGTRIHDCVLLGNGASYSISEADMVSLEDLADAALVIAESENPAPASPRNSVHAEAPQKFLLDVQVVAPELTFYDSTKWLSSSWARQEKLLRAKLDFNLTLSLEDDKSWIRSYVKGLNIENSSGAVVMDPLDISAEYLCSQGKSNILVSSTDIYMRPSFNLLGLVLRLHYDAVEKFKFGTSVLYRCTHFDRIWVNKPGDGFLPDVTFWRPKAPPGFVILGDCATSGMTPPSQGVVAISNTHHRVKKPLRYELVWSSSGITQTAEQETCTVWLPVAPAGYVPLGCVAERGTDPPMLSTAYCIRADLLTSAVLADCILYVSPGDRDYPNGCSIWRVENALGSFFARETIESPPRTLACELRQVLLGGLSGLGSDKGEDDNELTKSSILQRSTTLPSVRPPAIRPGRNSLTTPHFEKLWWDKGTATRRTVSIWRPVPPPGYAIVGDSIVDGLEPPAVGLVLRDDDSGRLIRPIRFQQRVHICGRGLEDVYIWYPISPVGYVALGCVATSTPDAPSVDMIRCVRMDLVSQASISKKPVWSYIASRGGHSCCVWRIENQASSFIARTDLKKPPLRMACYLAETGKPKVEENLTAEMKIGRFSFTVVHDLTGLDTPLFNATIAGINLAAHGRPDTLNAVVVASVAASTFNAARDAWEPFIEPFEGILKYESYDGEPDATLKVGKRIRISAPNTVNVNVSSASLETLVSAMREWEKQTESEQQALCSQRMEETDYRESRIAKAALEEDDTEKLVIHNNLFCVLYLRTYHSDFNTVEILREGGSHTVIMPPPRFPEKVACAPRIHPRHFVAVHVLEAEELQVCNDGNSADILCILRLVTTTRQPEEQRALPQSARSRCVRPYKIYDRKASARWNEVFIFEVPMQGVAILEVVVTNQAAQGGKGEALGILSVPVEEAYPKVSQAASLWRLVRQSISHESSHFSKVKVHSLKAPRKRAGSGETQSGDAPCGQIGLQLYYFSTSPDYPRDEKSAQDCGLYFSHEPEGPWESLRNVVPLTTIQTTLAGQQIAVDVALKEGRKHATFRSLILLSNSTDMPLEVAICPAGLLHSPDAGEREGTDEGIKVVEECFENQRYQPLAGWGSKWPGHLIPTDPGRWSTRDYSETSQEMLEIPLPPGWIWTSGWVIDTSGFTDQEGWFYGPDFQSLKSLPASAKAAKKAAFDFTRRRRWIRTRQRIPEKSHRRQQVGVVQPGASLSLPIFGTAPHTDYCAQVRPANSGGKYLWGRMVDSNLPTTPTSSKKSRQQRTSVSSSIFTLNQLEKHEQLLLCVASDSTASRGHCWLCMETFENSQAGDWKLSVGPPLRLENLLPCNAEYIIWEKMNESRPVKRQHGIASAGDWVHVYAADVRRQIFLTWLPQGGWKPEKEGVLIFDPHSEELPTGFWMVHQYSKRRLRVSLEYDFGSSPLAPKVARLFVPYWLSNDARLPLSYRLVELDLRSETPRGGKSIKPASASARLIRMLETVEGYSRTVMISPHAQPERLGLSVSSRVEDVLSPRIGLSVAISDSNVFTSGFSFRELEDNKGHVALRAYGLNGSYYKLFVTLDMSLERTKIVRLQPYSGFINRLGRRLQLRQTGSQEQDFLYPNQEPKAFLWRSDNNPENIEICLEGYTWSQPFSVEEVGTMHAYLPSETGESNLSIRTEVRTSSKHAAQLVIFRYASARGPYRIDNKSIFPVNYRQHGSGDFWQLLPPGSSTSFAWECLRRPRKLELLVTGADSSFSRSYKIDEAGAQVPLPVGTRQGLQVIVTREAGAQLVTISGSLHGSDALPIVPASRPQDRVDTLENQFHTSIELAELGVSVVDDTPEELLYLSVQNFSVTYSTGLGSQSRFKLRIDGLQVDNQLPLTPMPVLFSAQDAAKEAEFLLKCTVSMQENALPDQQVYPYIGIQGPNVPNVAFLINIHEPIIWRVHHLIDTLMKTQPAKSSESDAVAFDPIINIGVLNTSEIRFKVTLGMSPTQRPRGVLGFWSTLLTSLGNTDDMPVRITSHVHENICMSRSNLVSSAIASVRNDMLSQPLRLLSGVDLLGNASSALGHMSKGVAALSMDKKFIRSRQKQETKTTVEDIGDGIREGGEALAKGFFRGVTGILTKPFEGAKSSGVEGFIQGVGKGVIGVAVQPVSGILDLLSKTTEGANATRMKLAAVLTSEEQLLRRRLPRVIGGDKILRPYDEYKAQGQILLQLAQRGTLFGPVDIFKTRGKFATDAYEDHFNLPKARTLIITHRRVVLLQHPTGLIIHKKPDLLKNPCTILWDITWNELGFMELARSKQEPKNVTPSRLIFHLNSSSSDTSMFESREAIRVVKCHPGTKQAEEILGAVERAQDAYGPQRSVKGVKPGNKPYAGSTTSPTASNFLTRASVSEPVLATFGTMLGSAQQNTNEAEAEVMERASTSSSSVEELAPAPRGRFISNFRLIWSNKDDSDGAISIWRPLCPSGYASVGDVAMDSTSEPESVMIYPLTDGKFAQPLGFELAWRESGDGAPPLTIWKPRAPQGYVALGCVAVADYCEPENGHVWCARSDATSACQVIHPPLTWKSSAAFGSCVIWRVSSEAATFMAQKESQPPPAALAISAL